MSNNKSNKKKTKVTTANRPVYQFKDDVYIATYPSSVIAASTLGIYGPSITKAAKGQSKYAGGFTWSYDPPENLIVESKSLFSDEDDLPTPTPPKPLTRTQKREATRQSLITPQGHNLVVDIETSRYIMAINDNIPQYFLTEMKKAVSCDCTIEAYENFMTKRINLTKEMQVAIRKFYQDQTGERLKRTSCSTCWWRRVDLTRRILEGLLKDFIPNEEDPLEDPLDD